MLWHRIACSFALGLSVLAAGVACGQAYPSRPVRFLTAAAGGGTDFVARAIAQGISGPLGQPVIVENRPPILAGEAVAKAPPDGYTLLVSGGVIWVSSLWQKRSYDVATDFSPISLTERSISIVAVHPSVPARSIKELIALAKARPGELNYASGPSGAPSHLAPELFKYMAGVNIVHIAYKGGAAAMTSLLSGEVQMMIYDAGLVLRHAKSGKLRALAVTSAQPSTLAPGVPTVAASGLPGYEAVGSTGAFAPAKTPAAIINQLNQEIVRFLNQPDVKQRFLDAGLEVVGSSPEDLGAQLKSDLAQWSKVVKALGIHGE